MVWQRARSEATVAPGGLGVGYLHPRQGRAPVRTQASRIARRSRRGSAGHRSPSELNSGACSPTCSPAAQADLSNRSSDPENPHSSANAASAARGFPSRALSRLQRWLQELPSTRPAAIAIPACGNRRRPAPDIGRRGRGMLMAGPPGRELWASRSARRPLLDRGSKMSQVAHTRRKAPSRDLFRIRLSWSRSEGVAGTTRSLGVTWGQPLKAR